MVAYNASSGNGSDGVFLGGIPTTTGQSPQVTIGGNFISGNQANGIDLFQSQKVTITGNFVSGNQANGIDLFQSQKVTITGNMIGMGVNSSSTSSLPEGIGNAANGVFIDQSDTDHDRRHRPGRTQHHLGESRQRRIRLGERR